MERIDSFLIDRLFQPISDRFARWWSCYAIATFLLTGCLLFHTFSCVWLESWLALGISPFWLLPPFVRFNHLEQTPPSTVLPLERVSGLFFRVMLLVIQIFLGLPGIIGNLALSRYVQALMEISWFLFVFAHYFAACRRNPPKPKKARVTISSMLMESVS